jgi:leucyl-tRNA---protein transferase
MFTKIYNNQPVTAISKADFDKKMAEGWRLLGNCWTQHTHGSVPNALSVPTRIRLADYKTKKNDRRTLRINSDLRVQIQEVKTVYNDYLELFVLQMKKYYPYAPQAQNFFAYVPLLYDLGEVKTMVMEVFWCDRIVAASFFQVGEHWLNGNYCVYDRDFNERTGRSLGIFTMLVEIEYAKAQGLEFYTSGYTDTVKSSFVYKTDFIGLEYYNWEGEWRKYEGKFDLDYHNEPKIES